MGLIGQPNIYNLAMRLTKKLLHKKVASVKNSFKKFCNYFGCSKTKKLQKQEVTIDNALWSKAAVLLNKHGDSAHLTFIKLNKNEVNSFQVDRENWKNF